MAVTIIMPTCNLETVKDGRGGIFTWLPKEPLVEFNMLYFNPGKVRGFHFHPEFIEYLLVVNGNGTLVYRDDANDKKTEKFIHLSKISLLSSSIQRSLLFPVIHLNLIDLSILLCTRIRGLIDSKIQLEYLLFPFI